MSKILISYRREDSADATGRIYDRLVQQFGRTAVFKDVDSIPLGLNFRKHLDEQVAKCDVFLAVIGPDWMGSKAGEGKSRLDDPRDFVRIEIESALKRQIPVIPVLVRGATIPDPERLPRSLQELSDRNGIVVRHDPDFHRDMDRLIEHLRGQIEEQLEQAPFPDTHHKTSDVSARPKETHSEVEPSGQERIDAAVPPSKVDSPHRLAERVQEEPAISIPPSQKTTDQSQSFMFGVIGLIILIGGVAAFLILQPKQPPVEPIKYQSPPVVEKQEERPAQVTTSPVPTKPVEPTVLPGNQDMAVKKPVKTSIPSIPSPAMIRIAAGTFMMGGSGNRSEAPIHKVRFAKSFAIAQHEVTIDEYDLFAQTTGRQLPKDEGWGRGQRPVVNVSWDDAKAYAQWLSQRTGKRYRLPTEAEWEYAARSGGQEQMWPGTSDESLLKDYAVYGTNRTESVGSKKPNSLGLYDMSGNVSEWLEDCWHDNYKGAPADGSTWLEDGGGDCGRRIVRGGSWNYLPVNMRTSTRIWGVADFRNDDLGFRLAQDIP